MAVIKKQMVGGVVQGETPGKTVTMTQGKVEAPAPVTTTPAPTPAAPVTTTPAQAPPAPAPAAPVTTTPAPVTTTPAPAAPEQDPAAFTEQALPAMDQSLQAYKELLGAKPDAVSDELWAQATQVRFSQMVGSKAESLLSAVGSTPPENLTLLGNQAFSMLRSIERSGIQTPEVLALKDRLNKALLDIRGRIENEYKPMLAQQEADAASAQLAEQQMSQVQDMYGQLQAMAQGEGLDNSAAQQQLAQDFQTAQQRSQAMAEGPTGQQSAYSAQLAAMRESQLSSQQEQTSRMVRAQEQQWALQMASQLGQSLEQELADADFQDAQVQARTAEIYANYANAMSDVASDMRSAELVAEARKKAAEDASKDAWMRTIIGGAFTLGGMAVGSMAGPMGGAAGGMAAGALGNYVAGKV